jgi:glutamate dehydrogenase/leucine dehydrogenase
MNTASRMSFLGHGLDWLKDATITVLGAGGGGSHIAQQLAHLGVGRLAVIDPDRLENTNVNRVVGAGYGDVGELKAHLLAERFADLGTEIIALDDRAESARGRYWIEQSDVVFGAVDSARARRNIENLCRAALVPYIDVGLKIHVADDDVTILAIGGQIVTSLPGAPCLRCAEVVTEQSLLEDREEYLAGRPEQQVVSMNGILASQAVSGMLAVMTGYAPDFPLPAMITYDGLDHVMKPNKHLPAHCPHFPLDEAGWRLVLPARVAAA